MQLSAESDLENKQTLFSLNDISVSTMFLQANIDENAGIAEQTVCTAGIDGWLIALTKAALIANQ